MMDYNLWADLLDTFQSSSDYIKTVILIIPPVFVWGTLALVVWLRSQALRHRYGASVHPPQNWNNLSDPLEPRRGASRLLNARSGSSDQNGRVVDARSSGFHDGHLR